MKDLKDYDISFSGLSLGEHLYEFEIKSPFFEHFEFDEYEHFDLNAHVKMLKSDTMLEFSVAIKGVIEVPCDLSGELFMQAIEKYFEVVIKFGNELREDDEIIILPFSEYKWNIGQLLYEHIVLSIPLKKVHPGVLDGSIKPEYTNDDYIIEEEEELDEIDPRWAKLKDLNKDNND